MTSTGRRCAVGADEVERDLACAALQPEHRRVVRLVVDPPAAGEQVGEAAAADELVAGVYPVRLRNVWLTLMIVPSGAVDR